MPSLQLVTLTKICSRYVLDASQTASRLLSRLENHRPMSPEMKFRRAASHFHQKVYCVHFTKRRSPPCHRGFIPQDTGPCAGLVSFVFFEGHLLMKFHVTKLVEELRNREVQWRTGWFANFPRTRMYGAEQPLANIAAVPHTKSTEIPPSMEL
jgi:hypothetical protein